MAASGCILVLVAMAGWALFGGVPYQLAEQQNVEEIVATVDHFMRAGANNDVLASEQHIATSEPSSALSSKRIAALFQTRRDLFDGYARINQERYGTALETGWWGTRGRIGGAVTYQDGTRRPFQAELVKRNNQWKLVAISFTP
jgi:hypothetical protein